MVYLAFVLSVSSLGYKCLDLSATNTMWDWNKINALLWGNIHLNSFAVDRQLTVLAKIVDPVILKAHKVASLDALIYNSYIFKIINGIISRRTSFQWISTIHMISNTCPSANKRRMSKFVWSIYNPTFSIWCFHTIRYHIHNSQIYQFI